MKKTVALLLALVLLLSVCACGKTSVGEEVPEAKVAKEFSLGVISGNSYKNEFIGIGCTLDDSWSFYSEDEIKELNNIATGIAGEEYREIVANADLVYDMVATDGNGSSMQVNIEKLGEEALADYEPKSSLEAAVPYSKEALTNIGYTNVQCEVGAVEIDGQTPYALYIVSDGPGFKLYQLTFQVQCENYVASIAVSTKNESDLGDLLKNFYWL